MLGRQPFRVYLIPIWADKTFSTIFPAFDSDYPTHIGWINRTTQGVMPMARTRVVGRWLVPLLMAWAVLLWPVIGAGDWDPPGPPPIEVRIEILAVELLQDQDDGVDGNAELLLVVKAKSNAGSISAEAYTTDLNWDETNRWIIARMLTLGKECSPPSRVIISASLAEVDNGAKEQVVNILKTAAQAALFKMWKGWPGAATSIAGGVMTAGLLYLNGNDDLGKGAVALEGEKDGIILLDGPDGSARVEVGIHVDVLKDEGQCKTPPPPLTEVLTEKVRDFKKIIAKVFEPLKESYWTIFYEVNYEKGNPAGLSGTQMRELRKSLLSYYLRWPEAIAASLVADAYTRGADVSGAVREYLRGVQYANTAMHTNDQERRDVSTERALEAFERAALAAADADYSYAGLGAGTMSKSGDRLPFHIVTVPDYFSTDVGRSPEFPVFVFGTDDPVTLSVTGIPTGMSVTTRRLDPELPLFGMKLDLSGVKPGKYVLRLKALAGGEETTKDLTLIVN